MYVCMYVWHNLHFRPLITSHLHKLIINQELHFILLCCVFVLSSSTLLPISLLLKTASFIALIIIIIRYFSIIFWIITVQKFVKLCALPCRQHKLQHSNFIGYTCVHVCVCVCVVSPRYMKGLNLC